MRVFRRWTGDKPWMNCGARSSSDHAGQPLPRLITEPDALADGALQAGHQHTSARRYRRIDCSTNIRMKKCCSKSLKSHKERVRRQFLSLRQDHASELALRPPIGPQKPSNSAILGRWLLTSPRRCTPETSLRRAPFSAAVHWAHSVPTRIVVVEQQISRKRPVAEFDDSLGWARTAIETPRRGSRGRGGPGPP